MRMRSPFRWPSLIVGLVLAAYGAVMPASGSTTLEPFASRPKVAVLVYHRFADAADDSMTVPVGTFEAQLQFLHEHGFEIVPLRRVIEWVRDPAQPMPPKAVALTVDDGHRSVYDRMRPIVERDRLPVTLFIYPSAISNASYALTWEQIRALRQTGLFDVQSHTWWHPNFNVERRRQSPAAFRDFVSKQLVHSRELIVREVGGQVDMIAWPFGIYDDELLAAAANAGYVAGFTLDAHRVGPADRALALPRFLMVSSCTPAVLARLLGEPAAASTPATEHRR